MLVLGIVVLSIVEATKRAFHLIVVLTTHRIVNRPLFTPSLICHRKSHPHHCHTDES